MSDGLVNRFAPFSSVSHELTLGYKREFRPGGVLEIGVVENIIRFDDSPDFGIHVGLARRF